MSDEPLRALGPLLSRQRGAWLEGDTCSILAKSDFVVRGFEFALTDCAIDCTRSYKPEQGWVERLSTVVDNRDNAPSCLCPFDIKSTTSCEAGTQDVLSFDAQRRVAAFYVCVYSANPSYVDLVPNYRQDEQRLQSSGLPGEEEEPNQEKQSINSSKLNRLSPRSYDQLDPCSAAFRMPVWLLPEAIRRVRACAMDGITYVNPWTEVALPKWRPLTTNSPDCLIPSSNTSHYTSYQYAMSIFRSVSNKGSMKFDLVGVQPRLADFKLDGYLIQHKVDPEPRSANDDFQNVLVQREEYKQKRRYYFNSLERFDFFFYSFEFRTAGPIRKLFFFFPECVIDDSFYISTEKRISFQSLRQWCIDMDADDEWVAKVAKVIKAFPHPRRPGSRPDRPIEDVEPPEDATPAAPVQPKKKSKRDKEGRDDQHGFHRYELVMTASMQRFYDRTMDDCALRRQGLLIAFGRNDLVCDMGFIRYTWSDDEADAFSRTRRPPQVTHSLPPGTPVVPLCHYARHREITFRGPMLTHPEFRRLDATSIPRLILFDLVGPDHQRHPLPPAIVPSLDIAPTAEQRAEFVGDHPRGEFPGKLPATMSLLRTGVILGEYVPGSGPLVNHDSGWSRVWEVLSDFSSILPFQYPRRMDRMPGTYHCPLQEILQQYVEVHRLGMESKYESSTEDAA